MSPENTHKLMGFITRRYTFVHGFCFFKLFPIGCIGLMLFNKPHTLTYTWPKCNSIIQNKSFASHEKVNAWPMYIYIYKVYAWVL